MKSAAGPRPRPPGRPKGAEPPSGGREPSELGGSTAGARPPGGAARSVARGDRTAGDTALESGSVDPETRLAADDHESLRLWLRLLTCSALIERRIRSRLRERYATTLPRFDLMAQLERHPTGLRMGELSRRLMVTGGNVTGLTDQLEAEGLVERAEIPQDRRASAVRLTAKGRAEFEAMARAHERWLIEMLAGLPAADRSRLHALLGRLKAALRDEEGKHA